MKVIRLFEIDPASGFLAPMPERKYAAIAKQVNELVRGKEPRMGGYLKFYDPDGNDGAGAWEFTDDKSQAITFIDSGAAHECWRQVSKRRPVRLDGKPNRPLTQFNVSIEDA